jgi:hypothetical protein
MGFDLARIRQAVVPTWMPGFTIIRRAPMRLEGLAR